MKTLNFKTNIKCEGCIAKVTPVLNNKPAIEKWAVDLSVPERKLTVQVEDIVSGNDIIRMVEEAGYTAQEI